MVSDVDEEEFVLLRETEEFVVPAEEELLVSIPADEFVVLPLCSFL